jgi:hypothetical protein
LTLLALVERSPGWMLRCNHYKWENSALIDHDAVNTADFGAVTEVGSWPEVPGRLLLSPKHAPPDTLAGHLEFALKWEGVELPLLKQLFKIVPTSELRAVILAKPTGAYTRRLWFLYEWLMGEKLDLPDLGKVRAIRRYETTIRAGARCVVLAPSGDQ